MLYVLHISLSGGGGAVKLEQPLLYRILSLVKDPVSPPWQTMLLSPASLHADLGPLLTVGSGREWDMFELLDIKIFACMSILIWWHLFHVKESTALNTTVTWGWWYEVFPSADFMYYAQCPVPFNACGLPHHCSISWIRWTERFSTHGRNVYKVILIT